MRLTKPKRRKDFPPGSIVKTDGDYWWCYLLDKGESLDKNFLLLKGKFMAMGLELCCSTQDIWTVSKLVHEVWVETPGKNEYGEIAP